MTKRTMNAIHQPQDGLHWHWEDMFKAAKLGRAFPANGMLKCLHTELLVDDNPTFLRTGGSADNANWLGKIRELAPDALVIIRLYHPAWWTLDPVEYANHYHALLSRWHGHGYADRNVWQDPLCGVVALNEPNIERAAGTGAACSWWHAPGDLTIDEKVKWSIGEYKKIAKWSTAFWNRIDQLEPNRKALAVWGAFAQGHDCRQDAPESEYRIPEVAAAIRRCDVFNHHPYAHWNDGATDGPGEPDQFWGLLRGHRPKAWRDTHQPGRPSDPGGALAIFAPMPYIAGECGTFKHADGAFAARNEAAIEALWRADAATGRALGSAVYIWHGHDDHRANVIMHSPAFRDALRDSPSIVADVAWPSARPGLGFGGASPAPRPPQPPQPPLTAADRALLSRADAAQVLQFNPQAGLQKAIFADGFAPNSPEFYTADGRGQRAEHPTTGEVRAYEWNRRTGRVRFVTRPHDGGGSDGPKAGGLLWPVGEPESERHGVAKPAGWGIPIGFDQEYSLGVHTGIDISIPGEDDFGAGCYAVADGIVVHAGTCPGSWGNVIMIAHHDVAGVRELWSQYAHLATIDVPLGREVRAGERIGTVGNGSVAGGQSARFSAHLHFELRRERFSACHWPSGKTRSKSAEVHAEVRAKYLDPVGVLGTG